NQNSPRNPSKSTQKLVPPVEDALEQRLNELTERHPFLMLRIVPIIAQLFLILVLVSIFLVTGTDKRISKIAAMLYGFIFQFIFY
uniref:Uncharacterized protein n=1 Tax=Caenorhabditis japonica TaxID=281687 RepID=A0A8R1IGU2_CAEJA